MEKRKQPKENKLDILRHSIAHILAAAVLEKFPKAKLGIGPTIENGFYYDFDNIKITESELPEIEKKMRELIKENPEFKKQKVSPARAKKLFVNQPYKLELIKDLIKTKSPITIYTSGEFTDLCKGPHVKSAKEINPDAFKLTKLAGAYWRGDEKNKMLTRIYGLSFNTKKELDEYLKMMEEAEKRDHRVLGEKLELFMVDEKIGKGLPLWLPKGHIIRHQLENYMYNIERENGYKHVLTPHLAKEELYKTSGHLAHYKNDMYNPIDIEGEKYYLKPMNCPHHHSIYKHKTRSYKDLPLRIAEFGTVYRFERSGVLTGMIRVRGFTQNDAHIYTTPEKLGQEIESVLKLHNKVFKDFNITDYWYRLSLPDFNNKEKFGDIDIKNKKMWQDGSNALKNALKKLNLKFVEEIGEATFYGPKIDIQVKNVYGKEDSIATIQVDYYSAEKFNLKYIDKDGKEKSPIIIHRAFFGSFDRFFAFLLEQTAGLLPLWLSPVQVVILPIGEKQISYAQKIFDEMKKENIRVEIPEANETLGKRIREAELQKIPYILVVGDKEMGNETVNVRHYRRSQEGEIKIDKLIEKLKEEIKNKTI